MEEVGDRTRVRDDPGDVRRGGEASDLQRTIRVFLEPAFEVDDVDVAVGVLGDADHVRDRFPPRQFVGVVLEGPDEHDRSLRGRDVVRQVVAVLEGARDAEAEHVHEVVDRPGGTRPGEDDRVRVVGVDAGADQLACLLAEPGCLQTGAGRLRVRVGVQGEHDVADVVLDERQ